MSKHAPGPWRRSHETTDGIYIYDADEDVVAIVRHSSQSSDIDRANSRLIAAAPELLAALLALTEWGCTYTGPHDSNSPHELLIAARAAIAKAEGTAP